MILAKDNSYKETVLGLMMYYPDTFPSQHAAEKYLFLNGSVGASWNKFGQITNPKAWPKRKIQRIKESILGDNTKGDCNYSRFEQGNSFTFYPIGQCYEIWDQEASPHSTLNSFYKGEITPSEDWMQAIRSFCFAVAKTMPHMQRNILRAHAQQFYLIDWKQYFNINWKHYLSLREFCIQILIDKFDVKIDTLVNQNSFKKIIGFQESELKVIIKNKIKEFDSNLIVKFNNGHYESGMLFVNVYMVPPAKKDALREIIADIDWNYADKANLAVIPIVCDIETTNKFYSDLTK